MSTPAIVSIVWKLDRLGRSLPHLLQIVLTLQRQGVAFRSLTEQMDTTTPHGAFLFSLFGALAQYERALTQERITAGLAAAKRRGKHGGRPRAISAEQLEAILAALQGGASKAAICRTFGVKRSTLLDALARVDVSAVPSVKGRGSWRNRCPWDRVRHGRWPWSRDGVAWAWAEEIVPACNARMTPCT